MFLPGSGSGSASQISLDPDPVFKFLWIHWMHLTSNKPGLGWAETADVYLHCSNKITVLYVPVHIVLVYLPYLGWAGPVSLPGDRDRGEGAAGAGGRQVLGIN